MYFPLLAVSTKIDHASSSNPASPTCDVIGPPLAGISHLALPLSRILVYAIINCTPTLSNCERVRDALAIPSPHFRHHPLAEGGQPLQHLQQRLAPGPVQALEIQVQQRAAHAHMRP